MMKPEQNIQHFTDNIQWFSICSFNGLPPKAEWWHTVTSHYLGLCSLSKWTSYGKISQNFKAARFQLFWNLTGTSAAVLLRCLWNFRTIRSLKHLILWLRNFMRFGVRTSYHSVNRGPESVMTQFTDAYMHHWALMCHISKMILVCQAKFITEQESVSIFWWKKLCVFWLLGKWDTLPLHGTIYTAYNGLSH